jgi:hypothetical protein
MTLKCGVGADSKYSVRTFLSNFYGSFASYVIYTLSDEGKICDNMWHSCTGSVDFTQEGFITH